MTALLLALGTIALGAAAAASAGFAGAFLLAVIDDSQVSDQLLADAYGRWIQRFLTTALVAATVGALLILAAALVGQWPPPLQGWLIAALGSALGFVGAVIVAASLWRTGPDAATTADPVQEDQP